MQSVEVREHHVIAYIGRPEISIPLTVTARYTVFDDGFVTVEYLPETIDYICQGSA